MTLNAARFQKALTYKSDAAAKSVLADLDRIRACDAETEKQQSKWMWIMLLSVLLGGAMTLGSAAADLLALAAILGVVAAIAFVFSLVTYLRHRSSNIDNRRYVLATQLINLLRVDLARETSLAIAADFRRANHKEKLHGKGQAGPWKVSFYRDPWLQLSGRFADGTSFDLVHTELTQARTQVKRSHSGKPKHKSKTKHGYEAELRLRFKPSKYRHMASLQADAEEAVQLPAGAVLKKLKHTDRDLVLRVAGKGSWSVVQGVAGGGQAAKKRADVVGDGPDGTRLLSLMFLSLFQILNLSKAIDKAAASGESS